MNWRRPADGDRRVRDRFAWLPVELTDPAGRVVWLERYRHEESFHGSNIDSRHTGWVTRRRWQP